MTETQGIHFRSKSGDASLKGFRLRSVRDLAQWLRWRLSDPQRFLLLCIISGIACGLTAVAFHLSIHGIHTRWMAFARDGGHPVARAAIWILSPALAGVLVGLLLKYLAPSAVGSGIPQTKAAYHLNFGIISIKEAAYRFLACSLFVGFGNSLGREGPTVHICSAVASQLGQWMGLAKKSVQAMIPVGMGAGIAAAFNTPLAAITFVFEELLDDFSSKALGGILIAVVIAAVVSRSILGEHAAFVLHLPRYQTGWWMLVVLAMGPLAGTLGHVFVTLLLDLRLRFREQSLLPGWLRPGVGGLGVGILGFLVMELSSGNTGIFGIGYQDLSAVLDGKLVMTTILLLMAGKFAATILAYSAGGSGGIFAPVLFIGGMLGGVCGVGMQAIFTVPEGVAGACALLGMGAFFAAVIRCPMTSILIIFEMTRNYSLILPLMVGNMLAYGLASRLRVIPIYDALLLQDKISLKKLPSYRGERDWRNLPVSTIMTHDAVTVAAGETLRDAGDPRNKRPRHHAYPVVDERGDLCGMITQTELLNAVRSSPDQSVWEALGSGNIIQVFPDTSIRDAANIMVIGEVEQAPVVSRNNPVKLLGIITLHDIARQQNAINEKEE
jgi:chloride channel protein, CIC family